MAAYTLAWMLGEAVLPSGNTVDGAKSECVYRADVNLDYAFDEKDTIASKRLFCLTSPFSFSCGNLVPSLLKSSTKVTMLGKTSGGGACSVLGLTTADGTSFNISGFRKFYNVKNGIFYSNDEGAAPDLEITSPDAFYDRANLTKTIDAML
jgi:C-terminal processing protease CtpA/Prc